MAVCRAKQILCPHRYRIATSLSGRHGCRRTGEILPGGVPHFHSRYGIGPEKFGRAGLPAAFPTGDAAGAPQSRALAAC